MFFVVGDVGVELAEVLVGKGGGLQLYEIECIRGNWSVRELRRQIDSLYYQRGGLSKI